MKRNLKNLDVTNQKFGKLIPQKKIKKGNSIYWECLCDCGNIKEIRQTHLLSGASTSCGCNITIDIIGKRFGKLVVIERGEKAKNRAYLWNCLCDCGSRIKGVQAGHLREGSTTSCGCAKIDDITGQNFGRLIVLEKVASSFGINGDNKYKWRCLCSCGNELEVAGGDLKSGHTQSCGCFRLEQITKHGKYSTPLYKVWSGIRQRCVNSKNAAYHDYGGRGIILCEEWLNFKNFYDWAVISGYKAGLSIDRIDVNGNYEPVNCKWATNTEQARNKRNNIFITYEGVTKCLSEWAETIGISHSGLRARFAMGWSIARALTT